MTIERLAEAPLILYDARFGWDDPTRRQLADRAQRAGVTIEPVDRGRVRRGRAGPGVAGARRHHRHAPRRARPQPSRRLHRCRFDPPVIDTFAFITRRNAHLSPATRAFMELAAKRMEALQ